VQSTAIVANAASGAVYLDETSVMDDLSSSTVDGKPFKITDYPYSEYKSVEIINVVEYCYSFRKNQRNNYGLYIYVYNPQALKIMESSPQNKIQIGTNTDSDGNLHYDKFSLKFISKSDVKYANLFYKFKVVDRKTADGKKIVERVNSNERSYSISGIELLISGNRNATEFGIGGTYKFTGFAKGYGPDENDESTLSCAVENLETLELSVHHTNFRTNVSALGKDHYNEVNTVYFSVPERIFTTYGYLQKIRAEWWEYKTKMAVVTSNKDFYEKIKPLSGYELNIKNYDTNRWDKSVQYGIYTETSKLFTSFISYWGYNCYPHSGTPSHTYQHSAVMIPYSFYSPNVSVDEVFDFFYTKKAAGDVYSNVVADYIYNYSNNLGHGYIDCNGREISKDLFEDSVDDGRTMGHNDRTIDLEDTFDLNSYDSNFGWVAKFINFGFKQPDTGGDYKDVVPIYELQAGDLTGADAAISKNLLVNENDVDELKKYYAEETAKGKRVILFRFANTDYYSANATRLMYDEASGMNEYKKYDNDTYVAQQTVFLDFDIIELTFNKKGVYHVIPVVSSPTDIINGFTAPEPRLNWWKILLAVLFGIVLLIVLFKLFPYVLEGIGWVFSLPFKAAKSIREKRAVKALKKIGGKHNENDKKSD